MKNTIETSSMNFHYILIDLTHELDSAITTQNGGRGFNHDVHIDYADCEGEDKLRVMKVRMHAGIGTYTKTQIYCLNV